MPYIANPLEGLPIRNSFITDQGSLGTTPATDDTLIIYDLSATAIKQLTIANLQASVLASPTFTGVPAGPTANAGTSTTQLATTAFVTTATTALNTITEMTDVTISSIASDEVLKWNGSAWINQTLAEANILSVSSPTFTGILTVGNATIAETDLETIDGVTAGIAVASKTIVLNSSKNITGIGTIGSGNITSTGTVEGTTITATTAFVPAASDGSALGTAALEFSDLFLADEAVISLGDDDDVTLTHVVDTGILLSSTDRFQFGDAGTFIHQSANGVLTIESDTTVDINGAVVFDGALTGITNITLSGTLSDGNYTFATDGSVSGLGTVASGTHTIGSLVVAAASITDTSGAITFGNDNLSTTGTLAAGTTTIGSLVVAAASITDTSGAISFGNENLSTTGTLAAGTTTIGTLVAAAASITDTSGAISFGNENLTTTGTLAAGTTTIGTLVVAAASITDTSGSISFGDDNITTTGTVSAGNLTVTGTTTTVNSSVLTVVDPIIHLQTASGGGNLSSDTNKDVGLMMEYYSGSAKQAFLGFDDSAAKLTFIPDATLSSEVVSGSVGTIVANIEASTLAVTGVTTIRSIAYTWPASDVAGSLRSDGSGALTWTAVSAGVGIGMVIALGG